MMRVLRGFWKLLVGIKDALVLMLLLLFFGLLFVGLSARPNPKLASSGALVLALNGSIVEQPSDADPIGMLSGSETALREYRLRDVIRALNLAATDNSVKAVVLDLDRFTGGGQAAMAAVGQAIDGVKRAGKPVLAYATGYADDGYQLAAHASEVWVNPMGAVIVTGPGGPRLYYKGLFDKLGVTAHLYRAGKYKSAGEPYIMTHQSDEAKAANQALADSLWQSWQDDVAKARPKAKIAAYVTDPAAVIAQANNSSADGAKVAGLVDQVGDRIAFGRRIAALAGSDGKGRPGDYAALPLASYLVAHPEPAAGKVGVLTVAGEIVDGEKGPGTAGGDTIARLLLDELAKKSIKALVVRVDSPGGSVTASERIRSAILEAKAQGIPVVVSMGSVAASGGYWVSTPAQRIFAEPSTITGSIGVFALIPSFEGSLAKLGLAADGVATTPLSGQPDVFRGISPTVERLIQVSIDNVYRHFIGLVSGARKLAPAKVDEIAQGHVWAGGTARQLGLVDQFGTLDEAVAYAASVAGLSGADARPLWIEREPNGFKAALKNLLAPSRDDPTAALDPIGQVARAPEAEMGHALGDAARLLKGPAIQVRCLECGSASGAAQARPEDVRLLGALLARR